MWLTPQKTNRFHVNDRLILWLMLYEFQWRFDGCTTLISLGFTTTSVGCNCRFLLLGLSSAIDRWLTNRWWRTHELLLQHRRADSIVSRDLTFGKRNRNQKKSLWNTWIALTARLCRDLVWRAYNRWWIPNRWRVDLQEPLLSVKGNSIQHLTGSCLGSSAERPVGRLPKEPVNHYFHFLSIFLYLWGFSLGFVLLLRLVSLKDEKKEKERRNERKRYRCGTGPYLWRAFLEMEMMIVIEGSSNEGLCLGWSSLLEWSLRLPPDSDLVFILDLWRAVWKVRPQDPENFDEEVKSLVTAISIFNRFSWDLTSEELMTDGNSSTCQQIQSSRNGFSLGWIPHTANNERLFELNPCIHKPLFSIPLFSLISSSSFSYIFNRLMNEDLSSNNLLNALFFIK